MVDIHTHILPGLDDGAHDMEESVAMIQAACAAGTTDIVATPHVNYKYPFDLQRVGDALDGLRALAPACIRIHAGCELHFSVDNIQDALAHPRKYTLNNQDCVLIEFPDASISPSAGDIFAEMLGAGMTPVVAHPERSRFLRENVGRLARWVEMGVLMQITAQSLLGRFARQDRIAAEELMDQGLVHFVASDAHDVEFRPPSLREAYALVEKGYGAEVAACLFVSNPTAAISGHPFQFSPAPKRRRRWLPF